MSTIAIISSVSINSYANALVLIFFEGILFILLTVTGLRKMLFEAIPDSVKKAIPAGIGLFIAFLGLQNAGIVVNSDATLVNLVSLNVLNGVTWAQIMPIIVTIVGVLFIAILSKRNVNQWLFKFWQLASGNFEPRSTKFGLAFHLKNYLRIK